MGKILGRKTRMNLAKRKGEGKRKKGDVMGGTHPLGGEYFGRRRNQIILEPRIIFGYHAG
jgi:hypothetical protein